MSLRALLRILPAAAALPAALLLPRPAYAQEELETEHHPVLIEVLADGLEHPWGLALLPEGGFLVTERNTGHVRIGTPDGRLSEPLEGTPEIFRYIGETPRSQGGMFDVALHPEFAENRLVYLSFSKPTERGAAMAVARGRLEGEGDGARFVDVEEVFEMKPDDQDSSGLHFGGSLAFDAENEVLLLTIGDRRNISRAQDRDDQAGSILRMTYEGEPAPGNPFLDDDEADDYIWSWGHRNPQGLAVHPETGAVWSHEHGPEGGDEVNLIAPDHNYGWPLHTTGVDYSGAPLGYDDPPDGVVPPVHAFDETVAPSGLAFYFGSTFPEWEGDMLLGGMITEGLVRLRIRDGEVIEEEMIGGIERRVRAVRVDEDGFVWMVTDHADGEVLRLGPAPGD